MIYLFTLGRTIPLCLAELQALLKINKIDYKILHEIENHVIIEITDEVDVQDLLKQSGGIVKVASLRGTTATKQSFVAEQIVSLVSRARNDKLNYKNFGVSLVGFQENIVKICEELKNDLKMHYILPKEGHELSSAQIINKNILELIIVKTENEYQIFQTEAVQDINYWTKKDMGRPFIDDRLGMLPLKVARMMVNLGKNGNDMNILDPFCGMGSILAEAIDLGIKNVIGGDINADVLKKCEQNLNWFCHEFMWQHVNMLLVNSDAANISGKLRQKIDLIVTEPFMGDARKLQRIYEYTNVRIQGNKEKDIKNIVKGLEKMYLGCLKDWKKVLKPNVAVVIIVPEIELNKKVFTFPFLEICAKTGYNILAQYDYSREKAIVKRKIFLLKT